MIRPLRSYGDFAQSPHVVLSARPGTRMNDVSTGSVYNIEKKTLISKLPEFILLFSLQVRTASFIQGKGTEWIFHRRKYTLYNKPLLFISVLFSVPKKAAIFQFILECRRGKLRGIQCQLRKEHHLTCVSG